MNTSPNKISFLYKQLIAEYKNKFIVKPKENDINEAVEIREESEHFKSVRDSVESFKSCNSCNTFRDSLPHQANSFLCRRKYSVSDASFRDSISSNLSSTSSNIYETISEVLDSLKCYEEDKEQDEENLDKKLKCIIEELILTEEQYQAVLEKVITKYMPHVEAKSPGGLKSEISYLFGNIEKLFEDSKKFLALLKENPDVDGVTKAFKSSQNMFETYREYIRNKQKQDFALSKFIVIIMDLQKSLNDFLGLSSHLLNPLQRPGRYILLLESLLRQLNDTENDELFNSVNSVIEMVKIEMRLTNDYLAMDSIIACPFDLLNEGTFILKERFEMMNPLQTEVYLFMFEKSVIFTISNGENIEKYLYLRRIKMDNLNIVSFKESHPLVFHLIDYERAKTESADQYTYILKAERPRTKILWIEIIEKALWDQFYQLKEQRKHFRENQAKKLSREAVKYLRGKRPISILDS